MLHVPQSISQTSDVLPIQYDTRPNIAIEDGTSKASPHCELRSLIVISIERKHEHLAARLGSDLTDANKIEFQTLILLFARTEYFLQDNIIKSESEQASNLESKIRFYPIMDICVMSRLHGVRCKKDGSKFGNVHSENCDTTADREFSNHISELRWLLSCVFIIKQPSSRHNL